MSKKNKSGSSSLGRTLIKDRFGHKNRRKVDNDSMLHTTEVQDGYDWGRLNLTSITEESSFNEFLRTAELAGTEFQAEKLNIKFINPKQGAGLLSKSEQMAVEKKCQENRDMLKIPRRPKWTATTTAEELQRAENATFLEWRHDLAMLQENEDLLLTPYEKNLEFWRELWRVIERSDVIVQIVDARNPLLFRSFDLEQYVKEVNPNKMNMILVNKSDLLTQEQRKYWAEYFDSEGIRTAFFSASLATEELKKLAAMAEESDEDKQEIKAKEEKDNNEDENETHSDLVTTRRNKASTKKNLPICTKEQGISLQDLRQATEEINQHLDKLEQTLSIIEQKIISDCAVNDANSGVVKNNPNLLNRLELINFFKNIYSGPTHKPNITTIGMVGYPNVGKSSTINALMTQKKVSVSATPGKTKHAQTLFLDTNLLLCDCPGLVMPSFILTKADMILNGILPIDQMRDHISAINLLTSRIPRHILEDKYGIIIAKPLEGEDPEREPYAEEVLLAFGYNRGFMTSNGQPDQARAARYVCKDYVSGKLLYCVAPPNVTQEVFHTFPPKTRKEIPEQELPAQQQRAMRINKTNSKELDRQFFESQVGKAYVKGRSDFPHIRVADDGSVLTAAARTDKPWRHVKKERREKLRKKFGHLDQH